MNFDKRIPIYKQVKDLIKADILSGKLSPGEALASRRDTGLKYNINPNTVQRAYKELEEEGLIITDGNRQSLVTGDVEVIENLKKQVLSKHIEELIEKIRTLGFKDEDILPLIENYLKESEVKIC